MLELIYVLVAIITLALISVFFSQFKKKENKISRPASIAFSLVIAGIVFGDDWLVGYSLIGAGIIIAIDAVKKK